MKFLALALASMVWAGVSWAMDRWTENFWLSFVLGAVAAGLLVAVLGARRSAPETSERERAELRRIAAERDSE